MAERRKVFISHFKGDVIAVNSFIARFQSVLIPRVIGVTDDDSDLINSTNPDYVMSEIRRKYITTESTVTLVLLGTCTHSRRYVDWEIKASLRQGSVTPSGLLGVLLDPRAEAAHLPERFAENWRQDDRGYARYYRYPTSASLLQAWIEDAFAARTTRAHLIRNSQEMWRRNRACNVCGVTH